MKDEFVNRLGMFKTTLVTLNSEEHKPTWFNLPPAVFTTKVAGADTAVTSLEQFCQQQGILISGSTQERAREEREAIDAVHGLGRTLLTWFLDQGDETNAGKVDLTRSQLARLRDEALKQQMQTTLALAAAIIAGPDAVAAATYGIDAPTLTAVTKEVNDYIGVMNAPQASIAERKSRTGALRTQFNAVEARFGSLDDMVLQFAGTTTGRHLVAAYQAARVIRDLGAGPAPQPPAPPV